MNILIPLILFFTATFSLLSSTENNRIRSFDKLWRSVKEQYPYFERKNIDWNEIYKKYRPFVERAREDEDYILILRNMLAELEDGHADIIKPPLNLAGIGAFIEEKDNRIFVSQVLQDSPAETAGLKKGAEIIAVNDTLVSDYIYSLPTYFKKPRWRLRYLFFHGKINTSIVLTYKDPVEGIKRLEVKRLKKSYSHTETKIVFRKLEDEIGYIRIPVFTGKNIVKDFDKALKELFNSKGLIIDIRSNPGGSSPISDMIVGRFIEDEIKIGSLLYKKPKYVQGIGLKNYFDCIVKPRGKKYKNPVVILINSGCASACELFAISMRDSGRAFLIGRKTAGMMGIPGIIKLHGNIIAQFPIGDFIRLNGESVEGNGIKPDFPVENEEEDIEKAIKILKSKISNIKIKN